MLDYRKETFRKLPHLVQEASLDSKWRPSQETTTQKCGLNTEMNKSQGASHQKTHLHHCSCIYSLKNTMEEREEGVKIQNTRTSAEKQSQLEMAAYTQPEQ